MAEAKPDYVERETQFAEMAKADPNLAAQLREHPHPAKFAYETAVKHEKMKEFEDVDALKARIRAEVLAELETPEPDSKRQPSMAKTPSKTKRDEIVALSLDDLLSGV
jgi:hypothetical protein